MAAARRGDFPIAAVTHAQDNVVLGQLQPVSQNTFARARQVLAQLRAKRSIEEQTLRLAQHCVGGGVREAPLISCV